MAAYEADITRYYNPDITVEGYLSEVPGTPDAVMEVPESEARYVHHVEYASACGRHGLLTTYCVVPLWDGTLH